MPNLLRYKSKLLYSWALFLRLFLFFPLLALISFLGNGKYSWLEFTVHFAFLIFVGFCAVLSAQLLLKYEKKYPRKTVQLDREVLQQTKRVQFDRITVLTIICYTLGVMVSFIPSFFLFHWILGLLNGGIAFLCWIRLFRSSCKFYTNLLSILEYVITSLPYLLSFFVVFLFQTYRTGMSLSVYEFETFPLVTAFMFLTVSTGILLNQANLDRTMESMKHGKELLPKKIRLYNFFLIGGIMLLFVLFLLFYNQIVWLLKSILYLFSVGLMYLIDFLTIGPDNNAQVDSTETGEFLPVDGRIDENVFLNEALIVVLMIGLAVFFCSPLGRRFLKRLVAFPKKAFWVLISRISPNAELLVAQNSPGGYVDSVVDLLETSEEKRKSHSSERRVWKKSLKRWKKLSDPVQKIRLGYALMRNYAVIKGFGITSANTVHEAEKKMEDQRLAVNFSDAGIIYEKIRYAGNIPEQDEIEHFSQIVEQFFSNTL